MFVSVVAGITTVAESRLPPMLSPLLKPSTLVMFKPAELIVTSVFVVVNVPPFILTFREVVFNVPFNSMIFSTDPVLFVMKVILPSESMTL